MGSTKNKTPANKQKSQDKDKKNKKGKHESSGHPKAEIVVIMTDEQAQKCLKGAKAITANDVARQCGVKISAANTYLKSAAASGKITVFGGYSGHWIYKVAE